MLINISETLKTGKLFRKLNSKKSLTYPSEILSCKLPAMPAERREMKKRLFIEMLFICFKAYKNNKTRAITESIIRISLESCKILNAAPVFFT